MSGGTTGVRVAHLLRVGGYLEGAIAALWMPNRRTESLLAMARASLNEKSPGGKDEPFLEEVRALFEEAVSYRKKEDFAAAMARLRVAQDMISLRIIELCGE
ncbi:MAG: hypothetical protein K6T51_05580 [Rubrobacteraceae bacterium]|uniref:hypothetical protein n=1 Tax=Rubrobacter naiadicus TaxID=1392641 RepID=UPI002360656F|nr:hypothetical protein [Rubrobacter naiadicus]MBX6762162.1 hypothetical protein [Rubrobacteraceae bacterium]MCL6438057.1 hypothetical protein [Rubrobacteraceae bacterium]